MLHLHQSAFISKIKYCLISAAENDIKHAPPCYKDLYLFKQHICLSPLVDQSCNAQLSLSQHLYGDKDMEIVLKSDRAATSKFSMQERPHYYSTSSPPSLMCLLILPSPKAKTPSVHCVNKCEFM